MEMEERKKMEKEEEMMMNARGVRMMCKLNNFVC